MRLTKEVLERVIREVIKEEEERLQASELESEEPLDEDIEAETEKVRKFCSSRGFYELEKLLRIQNRIALASKGDLGKKG